MTHLPQGGFACLCPIYASNASFESIGEGAKENRTWNAPRMCQMRNNQKRRQRAHKRLKCLKCSWEVTMEHRGNPPQTRQRGYEYDLTGKRTKWGQ